MYDNLMHCYRCGARYTPQKWWVGYYPPGTSNNFVATGKLTENDCSVCREPPQFEPTPDYYPHQVM